MAVKTKEKNQTLKVSDENSTKKFDVTYMIVVIIAMVVALTVAVTVYFTSTFVMYSPEKVATQYINNIATLDQYDAMKYTTMIKNAKLGDFIYDNYMMKYAPAEDSTEKAPELTAEEKGQKLTEILNTMYPTFVDLIETYGFNDYNDLLTKYFEVYSVEFNRIYGHSIMTRDDMFAAFEGNVTTYSEAFKYDCESVYGNGKDYAEKYLGAGKAELSDDDIYSAGYNITVNSTIKKEYSADEVRTYISSFTDKQKSTYEAFQINPSDISEVTQVEVVKTLTGAGDKTAIAEKNAEFQQHPETVTLVKIGSQWYVEIAA